MLGWIAGVRKRIDDSSYKIWFTPRKATSIWRAVNNAKFHDLKAQRRMTRAVAAAFAKRKAEKSAFYAYEQATSTELSPSEVQAFQNQAAAWVYFLACPPGYKK